MSHQHRYELTDHFAYATFYKCWDCGTTREYSEGSSRFFDALGNALRSEPECRQLPKDMEKAVEEMTALAPPLPTPKYRFDQWLDISGVNLVVGIDPGIEQSSGIRGIDWPCEECGAREGSTLQAGWYRCNQCGYPGK